MSFKLGVTMLMDKLTDLFPSLPHLSILSQVGFGVVAASLVLYLLSRMPEMLLVTSIALIYAAVPLM